MRMIRWIPVLLIVALVGVAAAQQAPAPAQAPATAPTMAEKMAEGKVKAVDQAKKQVTLEDGTAYSVPATVQVDWKDIAVGKTLAISYVQAGQTRTARKIEVKG
jgi:hypothetical protein